MADDYSDMANYLIPDYILDPKQEKGSTPCEHPSCPLIVFINGRSGGQLGGDLLESYRQLLNPSQVYDLNVEPPQHTLHRIYGNLERLKGDELADEVAKNLRLIVAGGDGTASWLLGVVCDLKLPRPPPIATVPLGTGNNLPGSFGWGCKNPRTDYSAVKTFLQQVRDAEEMKIDNWHITMRMKAAEDGPCEPIPPLELPSSLHGFNRVSSTESMNKENQHIYRGGFWNYFSMGLDAEVSYNFHSTRKRHPEIFTSQFINRGTYVMLGLSAVVSQDSSSNVDELAVIKIMKKPGDQWTTLDIPHGLKSVICLNLPSFSGGFNPWGKPDKRKSQDKDFTQVFVDDGLIEVVGFKTNFNGLLLLSSEGHGTRLAQAHRVRFKFLKGAANHTYMRIDGEPWKQPLPQNEKVVVEISHHGQVNMLARDGCNSQSMHDESIKASTAVDDDHDSEDEDPDEKRKFGAAETFKLPENIDIASLS